MAAKESSESHCSTHPVSQKSSPPDLLGQEQMVLVSLPDGTHNPPTNVSVTTMPWHQQKLILGESASAKEGPGL